MIIEIEIENWMSFRDKTKFSMLASLERQHNERIARVKKFPMRILPITSIYGGNASGKSIFFKGISFAQNFIIDGLKPDEQIPVETYRLDPAYKTKPVSFKFTILIDEIVYEYSFSVTNQVVVKERLDKITSASEKTLFIRDCEELTFIDASLPNQKYLEFAFHGTNENQLFLTNSVFQKVKTFKPVFEWFKEKLFLIDPKTQSGPSTIYMSKKDPVYESINKALFNFDTGIVKLGGDTIPLESIPYFSDSLKKDLLKNLVHSNFAEFINPITKDRIIISKEDEDLVAKKLVSYHQQSDGNKVKFKFSDESDGTVRLIDLLPGFFNMSSVNNDCVYIIDELDRSLHSMLTRQLLNIFLCKCNEKTRSQLIFTTHDLFLMDQHILRRDEMWIAERSQSGASKLISFAEFKDIRSDKDIRKSYVQGRFGGIPNLLITECYMNDDLKVGFDL